jgi:hypothetical protein
MMEMRPFHSCKAKEEKKNAKSAKWCRGDQTSRWHEVTQHFPQKQASVQSEEYAIRHDECTCYQHTHPPTKHDFVINGRALPDV